MTYINSEVRNEVFRLLQITQDLHIAICQLLINPAEDLEKQVEILINEMKVITKNL